MADTPQSPSKRQILTDQRLSPSPKRSRIESGTCVFRDRGQLSETNSGFNDLNANTSIIEPKPATSARVASKCSSPELSDSDSTSSSSSTDSDSESESEDASSSDEESSDDGDQTHNETRLPSRPSTNIPNNSALRARLASFIPSLKAANEDLEREIAAGKTMTLEVDNEDEGQGQYIEMNLGLGVLQEKGDEDGDNSSVESESHESGESSEKKTKQEKSIIDKLMGKSDPPKPNIKEIDP